MKFIHITDTHIDITNPVSRQDNYFEGIMADLEYVFAYAKDNDATAILHSGDLFHKANQPGSVMHPLVSLMKQYGIGSVIPFYITVGQHDTSGHNIDDYWNKSLGLLEAVDMVKVLKNGDGVVHGNVVIRGYAFGEQETSDFLDGRDVIPDDENFHIGIVHAQVGPDDAMGWQGISSQNIKSVDLALFGDIHCGFEPYEFPSGAVALGCGSLGRRNKDDRGRKPRFLEIDVDAENGFNLKFHFVPTLPDEDVFVEEDVCEDDTDLAAQFKEEWRKAQLVQDESPIARVRRIGQAFGHSEREIELVLERMPQEQA